MAQRSKRYYMRHNPVPDLISITLLLLMISGCASPISSEARKEANGNLEFTKVLENPSSFHGVVVIWGGVIIKAVNRTGESALFIQETPLNFRGRPKGTEFSQGLFIARSPEFLDPQTYFSGRKVTVAGEIIGEELGKFKETPYVYPIIKIREIHPWEKEHSIQWNWGKLPFYLPNEFNPAEEYRKP